MDIQVVAYRHRCIVSKHPSSEHRDGRIELHLHHHMLDYAPDSKVLL